MIHAFFIYIPLAAKLGSYADQPETINKAFHYFTIFFTTWASGSLSFGLVNLYVWYKLNFVINYQIETIKENHDIINANFKHTKWLQVKTKVSCFVLF